MTDMTEAKTVKLRAAAPAPKPLAGVQVAGDRVMVREHSQETMRASGIVMVETAKEKYTLRGYVVAVGPGKRLESGDLIPPPCKVGDFVIFDRFTSTTQIGGDDYRLVPSHEVICVLDGPEVMSRPVSR